MTKKPYFGQWKGPFPLSNVETQLERGFYMAALRYDSYVAQMYTPIPEDV